VAVLLPYANQEKADESIPDTKGCGSRTPTDFPLHNSRFWGPRGGAIIAILDPLASRGRMVGEDHPPLWQYLRPAVKDKGVFYTAFAIKRLFTIRREGGTLDGRYRTRWRRWQVTWVS
jgi:hypothetical protein